jgi:hypothetical protein
MAAAHIPSFCLEQGTRNEHHGLPSSPALVASHFSAVCATACSQSGHEDEAGGKRGMFPLTDGVVAETCQGCMDCESLGQGTRAFVVMIRQGNVDHHLMTDCT